MGACRRSSVWDSYGDAMKAIVVVGTQWGDEGKGKVVDYLSKGASAVARYQGGNNAGHTVVVHGKKYKLHFIPSGVVRGKLCVLGNGMAIEPRALLGEISMLEKAGLNPKLVIDWKAHVITQEELDEDSKDSKIGTTKKGIGPCYRDKVARRGLRIIDLLDRKKLEKKTRLWKEYYEAGKKLEKYFGDASLRLQQLGSVLIEGAQGTMLDIDHGTYPFVTSSNTVAGGACTGLGIGPKSIKRVVGIAKAYTTRVGNGPFPTELDNAAGKRLRVQGNEYGTTTGRPRRCGWFDAVVVRYAARVSGLTEIALTKLDVLDGFKKVKVCVAYRKGEKVVKEMPPELGGWKPVYIEMPGWESSRVKGYASLPKEAKAYVRKIEQLAGVPVRLVSIGPGREETFRKK